MAASPGSSTNGSATAPPRPSQNESAARTSYPSTTQSEKPPVKEPPCSTLEYHQFDFWLGDWDAFDMGKPDVVVARTKITSILNGCAILEEYDQSDGMHGRSFSIYDSTRKIWHQTWVTNNGRLLVIEGRCETGAMTLAGIDHPAGETEERYIRGIWKSEGSGVRETAQTSRDAGKTWQPWFDIVFRKH
jgi:hypothetical protein